jgi:hypothetical protein
MASASLKSGVHVVLKAAASAAVVAVMAAPAFAAGPKAYGKSTSVFIDDFTATTFTPILSKTFRAPAKGVVMITASVNGEDDSTFANGGRLLLNLKVDAKQVWDGDAGFAIATSIVSGIGANSGSATAVVPVSAGDHTVSIIAKEIGSGTFIKTRSLSIVYFPNGSGFAIPVPSP